MASFLTDAPSVDYLRLTSWNGDAGLRFFDYVREGSSVDDDAFFRGYRGVRSERGFAGWTMQVKDREGNRAPHYLLDVSGPDANMVLWLDWGRPGVVDCRRIDLQITVREREGYRARLLKDALEVAEWVRRRRLHLEEGDSRERLDTLYIGSRQSDRFARIYVKEDEQRVRYVRFEVEFKGNRAELVAERVRWDRRQIGPILVGEYGLIPAVDVPQWLYIGRVLERYGAGKPLVVPEVRSSRNGKMEWLRSSCMPVIYELLHHHETQAETLSLLGLAFSSLITVEEKNDD